jgi:hypothetical protein
VSGGTFTTILDFDREVEVDYAHHRATHERCGRCGEPSSAPEPAEVELVEVRDASTGKAFEPSPAEAARLEELAWDEVAVV